MKEFTEIEITRDKAVKSVVCQQCGKFVAKGEDRIKIGRWGWSISFHAKCANRFLDRVEEVLTWIY